MTICQRAHSGLIRARADRFIVNEKVRKNVEIPKEFWWAEGHEALTQNWPAGDFDTWLDNGSVHLQAYGVLFLRTDIQKLIPAGALTPEALYLQLGNLVAEMPDLAHGGPITPEMNRWLGRAAVLVETSGDKATAATIKLSAQNLHGLLREGNAQTIAACVHQALAKAELLAPASYQGSFIAAGNTFSALAAVGKALSEAKTDVLLVDSYADHKVITDYAIMAPDKVSVRLLAKTGRRDLLVPAAGNWVKQFGQARQLAVRLAPANSLHDRLIIVDGRIAWALGQSFNALAERAHTTLVRVPQDTASEKIAAYEAMWASATPL